MWQGRLLDLYPNDEGQMVVWLKTESGEAIRLTDRWLPSLYVRFDKAKAKPVLKEIGDLVPRYSFCLKFAEPSDAEPTRVLRLFVPHRNLVRVAERIEESVPYGSCTIYNADVSPGQAYLYEHDLFPLAKVRVNEKQGRLEWEVEDSAESTDYDTSFLKVARVTVYSEGDNRLGKFSVPIARIDVKSNEVSSSLDQGSEDEKILGFVEALKELDPDIVLTDDGDSFALPYIFHRAEANQLSPLVLGRDNIPFVPPGSQGRSYVSYGKVMYRAPTVRLYGRVHLDESNTFMVAECGPEGLFEVARTCRIPLHEASRGSIGKCMSSLQFYEAYRSDMLVPWKASNAEHFKDAMDLLVADRGGFIFEPVVGLHENIGEIDFNSLYPNIMLKFNLSGETVLCECCPDSPVRVPELGYHICARKRGIVPSTLELLLKKRARYKELMKMGAGDEAVRKAYNARQAALKWILVCSFGFLGFRNAKFGRIDSHIAVCAFARKILLDATRIAERRGFRVLHGIVDSLWLKKEGAREEDYVQLCGEIEKELGFKISFEGIYRWIAFLPSKADNSTPVLNRYFGVFRDGKVKFRGVEARRRDTPRVIALSQVNMLNILARGESIDNAKRLVPEALESLAEYARAIRSGYAPLSDLLVERQLSKSPSQYLNKTPQAQASKLLAESGTTLQPGRIIRFIITDSDSKEGVPEELMAEDQHYDASKYIQLLVSAASTVLEPFGCSRRDVASHLVGHPRR